MIDSTMPLGDAIMVAAADWEAERAQNGALSGREMWMKLRLLAERAEAADRLAVAYRSDRVAYLARENAEDTLSNRENAALFDTLRSAEDELRNAYAAWRKITEGVTQ